MRVGKVIRGAAGDWMRSKAAELRYRDHRWTVLCLHDVKSAEAFDALLESVSSAYTLVSLSDGRDALHSPELRKPLCTLTFDDGDKTVWKFCLPRLLELSIPACLFVCTSFTDAGYQDCSLGRFEVMSWSDVRDWVRAGLEIGAHTVNHIPLNQATLGRCKWEILESKRIIEDRLNCEVQHFAYPWGYYTDELDRWLEEDESFSTICSTVPKDNYPNLTFKRINRKPPPAGRGRLRSELRNPTLYETVRAAHQRSVLNGLAPVVWRTEDERSVAASNSVAKR